MPTRIAIDLSSLCNPRSGIGRSIAGLMSELPGLCAEKGISLVPFVYRLPGEPLLPGKESVPPLRLPPVGEVAMAASSMIERRTGGQLFHATDFYVPLSPQSPMIATVHDVIYELQPEGTPDQRRIADAMRCYVSQCLQVITCSHYSAAEFCALYGYPAERVRVVYWGIDTEHFRPGRPVPGKRPYFFAVSCNETRKNTPRLVRAFLRYAAAGGGYDLKLAWDLPAALADEVVRSGLASRVHALGAVGETELLALYRGAACVMFPSLYEGFGFPVLEALACGVPVLTTRRSSLPEVGGDLALYVDGCDTGEMTARMHEFERGEHAGLVARCAGEGPCWARRFRWRDCAEGTLQTYLAAATELAARPWQPLDLRSAA